MNVENEIESINDLVKDANNAFDKFEQLADIANKLLNEIVREIDNVPTTLSQRKLVNMQSNRVMNYRAICEIVNAINKLEMTMMSVGDQWKTGTTTAYTQANSVLGNNAVKKDMVVTKLI